MTHAEYFANRAFIAEAQKFAHDAHSAIKQVRKYSGLPYWVHTDAVASIVNIVTDDPDLIAAAHLHDTIEDVFPELPSINLYRLSFLFGPKVGQLVNELTDVFTSKAFPKSNRKERKQLEAERLSNVSAEAQTIKLADLINNSTDIVANDPGFAVLYLKEKEQILKGLTRGSSLLQKVAWQILEESWQILNKKG